MVACGYMEFLFSCSTRHLTRSLPSLVRHRVKHEEKFHIYARPILLLIFFRMLVVVLTAITTPFVSLVLQTRDIDAYVLLDLRELIMNKVRR